MKKVISSSFSVSAQKSAVSVDHIDNYYLLEASGTPPSSNDTRWKLHRTGENIPVPTSAAPFLWHKSVTYLSDGTHLDPVIEFGGSLGQNGIDYDLVPSHSSILKAEDGTLAPTQVSCNLVKRNADGSAEQLSSVPAGYSVLVYKDAASSSYTLGSNVSTSSVSVITFVLLYGNIEIERHDIRVIAEGGQGVDGRGIQSQDYRFKANTDGSVPSTPTNDTQWNTWSALSDSGYSSTNKYLFRCLRTVYINGNGTTETTYLVDGPTVWGTDGKDIFVLDLDNEMDSVPCDSTGKVTAATTITTHARLYRGDTVLTSGVTAPTATSIKIDNVTPTVQTVSGVVTVSWTIPKDTTLSSEHLTVNIPVTYDGRQYVAVFTLNAVKSGAPGVSPIIYSVIPSVNACPFTRDANDTLTPESYSVECGYSKTVGSSVTTEADKAGIIDSNYRIFYRYLNSSGVWSGWIAYSVARNITSGTTYTAYEFCIASVTSAANVNNSNILDREMVPITKSGAKGNDGTSALSADLSDEQTSFGTSSSGAISAAITRETYVSMFYGTTPLDITMETAKAYEDGTACGDEVSVTTDNTTGKVSVTLSNASSYTKTIHIDITAKTSRGDLTVRYTLQPVPAGANGDTPTVYQLLPSPSALSFERDDSGNLIVASKNVITFFVKKIEGDATTVVTSALSGYRVYYGYGNPTTPTAYVNAGNGQVTVSADSAETYTSLVAELWQINGNTKVKRLDRETIVIHKDGRKGNPGDPGNNGISAFVADIDNEMTSIPIGSDGKVSSEINLSFGLAAYYGITPVLDDCTVELVGSEPSGFSVNLNDKASPTITIASGTAPSEITEITIRVSHATYGARDVVFSIAAVKSGGKGEDAVIYELIPSETAVHISRTAAGALTPNKVTILCGYKKTVGNTSPTVVDDPIASFDGYNIYFRRFLLSTGNWGSYMRYYTYKSYLTDMDVTTASKVEFIICKNTGTSMSASGVTGLIDRDTVPLLLDGAPGQPGDPGQNGTSPMLFDLDNEFDSVPCTSGGTASAQTVITTHARLYRGTTLITNATAPNASTLVIDGVTPTVSYDNGVLTVSWTFGQGTTMSAKTTKDITLTLDGANYGQTFTLNGVRAGYAGSSATIYSIVPDYDVIKVSKTNSRTPATIKPLVNKTVGTATSAQSVLSTTSGLFLYYKIDSGSWTRCYTTSEISTSAITTALRLRLQSAASTAESPTCTIYDQETIPVISDGKDSTTPGADGNGIKTMTTHRMHTPTLIPPAANDSGWIAQGATGYPSVPAFNDINHYLWEKRTITYTKITTVDVQIVLVASYDTNELRPQLLLGTAFDSEDTMTDWEHTNGAVVPEAFNGQNAWGFMPQTSANYYELLRQRVYVPGDISKIQSSQWYTLSFYARDRKMVGQQSNKYGFADHSIYLMPGTYRLEFNGRCSAAARSSAEPVSLNGYMFNSDWTNAVSSSIITTEDSTVKTSVLTVTTAGIYNIKFYANKGNQRPGNPGEEVRINWFRVICESRKNSSGTPITGANNALATYIYPSALDNSGVRYMDGQVVTTLLGDGCVYWNLANDTPDSDGWTRHWISFKTKSQITAAEQAILFRNFGAYMEIAAVKLERGVMPTAWCEHNYDSHTECSHNPCGKWRAGTTYYYCNGQRDVVRAKASASGGATWWRMKRRTAHTGYLSNTEPYADTEHWERGNNLKFSIVDAMFAEEIVTDKLTVTKLLSTGENSHIAMQNGVAEFYGVFAFPNIRVGVDDNGCSILEFYGADGQKMYDLGPNGLSKIDTNAASFTEVHLMLVKTELTVSDATTVYNLIKKITKNDTTAYYQFSPKRTTTGTTTVYWYGGTSHSTAPAETGKCYQSKSLGYSGSTQDLPTGSLIPNGWYAKQNDGFFPFIPAAAEPEIGSFTPSRCKCLLYYYSSGKQTKTGYVQWETAGTENVSNITLVLN